MLIKLARALKYLLLNPLPSLWDIRQQQSLSICPLLCLVSCEVYLTELGYDSWAPGGFWATMFFRLSNDLGCLCRLVRGANISYSYAILALGPSRLPFTLLTCSGGLSLEAVILPVGWLQSTERSMVKVLCCFCSVTGCFVPDSTPSLEG